VILPGNEAVESGISGNVTVDNNGTRSTSGIARIGMIRSLLQGDMQARGRGRGRGRQVQQQEQNSEKKLQEEEKILKSSGIDLGTPNLEKGVPEGEAQEEAETEGGGNLTSRDGSKGENLPEIGGVMKLNDSSGNPIVPMITDSKSENLNLEMHVTPTNSKQIVEGAVEMEEEEMIAFTVEGRGQNGMHIKIVKKFPFTGFSIGRNNPEMDIDLGSYTAVRTISHKHASIIYNTNSSQYELHNYGRNGSRLNGDQFGKDDDSKRVLKNGDVIEIGKVELKFLLPQKK